MKMSLILLLLKQVRPHSKFSLKLLSCKVKFGQQQIICKGRFSTLIQLTLAQCIAGLMATQATTLNKLLIRKQNYGTLMMILSLKKL